MLTRPPISVAIITLNEAKNIQACIESAVGLGPVIVVDAESSDQTAEIARQCGATVFQRSWTNFSEQKQSAVETCDTDWVLVLDADERLVPSLLAEISHLDLSDPGVAYAIPRTTFFLGRAIKYCGWRPDYVIRLFNKSRVRFNNRPVHESVIGYQSLEYLTESIHHFSYPTRADVIRKIDQYSRLGAEQIAHNQRAHWFSPFTHASWSFFRTYVLKAGFLDGYPGFEIARMNAQTTFRKYLIARQMMEAHESSR
jgi:glycosyltransferase involved in cell wall biosynthesis